MRIYLSARYSRHPEMRIFKEHLESIGFTITSRWINGSHELGERLSDHEENHRFANEDIEDVKSADLILWFSEPNNGGRGGRHVEFGLALALNIPIHVIGRKENVFHYFNNGKIKHHKDLESFKEYICQNQQHQ